MKNKSKKKVYRVCQFIMAVAIGVMLFATATLASAEYWSWPIWMTYFLVMGISAGTGATAWWIAVMIGWNGDEN